MLLLSTVPVVVPDLPVVVPELLLLTVPDPELELVDHNVSPNWLVKGFGLMGQACYGAVHSSTLLYNYLKVE